MSTSGRPEPQDGSTPDRTGGGPAGESRPETEGRPGPEELSGWLDAGTAERLLDGAPGGPQDDPRVAELARLLARAAEEAGSLTGGAEHERRVLQAFRDARREGRTPAGQERRRARWRRVSRPTKALVGGLAAAAVLGGVAIAAQTGALPHPFHSGSGAPGRGHSSAPPAPSSGTPGPAGTGRPTASPDAAATTAPAAPSAHPSAPGASTPAEQSLKGLCLSYVWASRHGERLDSAAQHRLEAAAGGSAEVAPYCARLTGGRTPDRGRATPPSADPTTPAPQTPAPRASSRRTAPAVATSPARGRAA
jgi:hypothetical protein